MKLHLWDTSGDEKHSDLTKNYFQGADAAIVVYEIPSSASLVKAETWISRVRKTAPENVKIFLVGNKSDLVKSREVERSEGKEFAKKHKLDYFIETSAKENDNIRELFQEVTE